MSNGSESTDSFPRPQQEPEHERTIAPQADWLGGRPPAAPVARSRWTAAALVVGGLLVGGATVATVQAVADDGAASAAAGAGAFGGPGGGARPGGPTGEQHLAGTLTEVSGMTVTVSPGSGPGTGTDSYTLTGDTQIVRDGAPATVEDLQVGDPVLVHVYPSSSGDEQLVERLFAGTLPPAGGLGPGPGAGLTADDSTRSTT